MKTNHIISRLTSHAVTLALFGAAWITPVFGVPPVNDNFESATVVLDPLPFMDSLSTAEATAAPGDGNCVCNGPTVWYKYTPASDATVAANTFGSSYETTLSAYLESGVQLACKDDFRGLQSQIILPVTAGTTVYFMVGAYASGPGGDLVFTLEAAAPPVEVEFAISSPIPVRPEIGAAAVTLAVSASAPVFLYFASVNLVQPTGRGHVTAFEFSFIGEETDSFVATIPLKDTVSFRSHGEGFAGGNAKLTGEFVYWDPFSGYVSIPIDQNVQLTGATTDPGSRVKTGFDDPAPRVSLPGRPVARSSS